MLPLDLTGGAVLPTDNRTCMDIRRCLPLGAIVTTILSSLASVLGSLLIIGTFLRWKDLRTVARMILVFLAIADLLTGLGYIFGAAIYSAYQYPYCNESIPADIDNVPDIQYTRLCTAQSFFTTLFPIASFFWTGNLSIYLFITVGLHRNDLAKKLMIPFHVTAWGIPLVICVALLGNGYLGPSGGQSNADWCWIKKGSDDDYTKYFLMEFIAGKMWEILVIILSLTLFLAVKIMIWRRYKKKESHSPEEPPDSSLSVQFRAVFTKLDQKLLWIPVVFVLVRMWGIIRFFLSVPPLAKGSSDCHNLYSPVLAIFQSIGDPGQGWSNALLFVIFNGKIFQRLCPCLYSCGVWCLMRCESIKCRLKRKKKRMKRSHIVKKAMLNSGIVTYDERQSLVTDSIKSSVIYQSTATEDANLKKKSFTTPNGNTSSINESTK